MSILGWLGLDREAPRQGSDVEAVREIAHALDGLEPARARFVACFAYLLGRVARADEQITPDESRAMERLVAERGLLPEAQAVIVVQMAKTQGRLFGGTEDFLVTREFDRIASREEKLAVIDCLFAVCETDQSIVTVEDNEIRQIANELKIEHADYVAIRLRHRRFLEVLKKTDPTGDPQR
ncbi:MAG TPA: TerB family tellurite resistance protein [Vicinamibacterales bacterium]|nr:TerB family tellurite resistance protein [Vicinamibacterales bacterium]